MRWWMQVALLRRGYFACLLALLGSGFSVGASAQAYLETGQTGAQTQIDVSHTTTLYLGVLSPISLGGANYVMKRGSASTADVSFTVYPDTTCTGTPLAVVTNTSSAFAQTYGQVLFQIPGNISLSPGAYCTKLTSAAGDQQNEAFFIKGFDACVVLPANQANGAFCSTTIPVIAPSLSLSKNSPSPGLTVGAQSTYSLAITNSGNIVASTARVLDQLPAGLTFVSANGSGWSCSNASGLVTCDFSGSMAASGGTSTVNVTVSANAGTGGQTLTNYASIDRTGGSTPPTPGPSCTTAGSCASNTATVSAPVLAVVKSAPTPALSVGAPSTYTLTITNSGTAAANTAQVKDQLPSGLSFVSATGTGWSCTNASGLVTCDFSGSISAVGGTSTVNVTVSANTGTGGQSLTNYASIDPTGGPTPPTPGPSCSTAGSCSSVTGTVSAPNLAVVKSAPTPALSVGAQSTYALTVTNSGTAAATTAQVKDQLPAGLAFVSATGTGWSCSNASGLVTCNFSGSIAASGGISTVNVTVSANTGTGGQSLTNYVSIDPTGGPTPPTPGPACSTAGACSSVTGTVSSPNLAVVKSAPTPALSVGAQSTYALTVTNSGTAAATTAQAKDQLPAGLTFVSATGMGWSCSNASGLVTCNFSGSIAASGGTSTVNVTVSTNAGTGGQSLTNYASIDPTGGPTPPTPGPSCSTPGNCSSSTSTVSTPNLSIAKAAPTPGLNAGAQSTYLLTISNSGTAAATTARIQDQLPAGLTFVSATGTGWSCSNASGLVTCNFSGTIAAGGGSSTVSVTVSANTGTGGQSPINYASIDPTGGPTPPIPGPSCTTAGSCASVTSVVGAPSLGVVKSAPMPALSVGSQSTYTLTVTNSGTTAGTTAQVKDQLPAGLTYVSATGTGWSCTNASGLVTCNFSGSIAAGGGSSVISMIVTTNAGTSGQSLTNYASIDPTGGPTPPTPGPSCTTAGSCGSNTSTVSAPVLAVVKSAPTPALSVGAQSSYALTVTNSGTASATTAQVKDHLPSGLTFVSTTGSGWSCTNASGVVTCNFSGSISAGGGTSTVNVTVSANAGTGGQSLTNYASIDPTGGPTPPTPGPSCSTAGSCTSVTSTVSSPILAVVKSAPTPALSVGAQSTYALTVTNSGTVAATTAQVKDQLPTGLTFVSATGTGWTCSNASGLVTCNFSGSISASGGTSRVNVRVSANAGTSGQSLTNYVSIDPTGGPTPPTPGPSCTTAGTCSSVTGTVSAPNLSIVKSAPTPGLVIGSQSTYLLTLTNSGTAVATTAHVKDQLPSNLTFVSATGSGWSCTNASGLVTCNFNGIMAAGGGTTTISMTVLAVSGSSGQPIVNYAAVDPTGGPSTPTPGPSFCPAGSCSLSSSTLSAPNLTIAKAAPVPGLDVGAQSAYVLTVRNGGNASVSTAQVKDQLPSELTFVSATGAGWNCGNVGGLITCNYSGNIAGGGGSSSINVVVTPVAGAAGKSLTNFASVDPTGGSGAPAPGPSCSPSTSCASVTSSVGSTKARTEAIIHNFLAKRGDRLASNGLDLNRLINRVTDETCAEDDFANNGRQPQSSTGRNTQTSATAVRGSPAASSALYTHPAWAARGADPLATSAERGRLSFGSGLSTALPAQAPSATTLSERSTEVRDVAPPTMAFGPVGSGTGDQGRMSLNGSLAEVRKARAATETTRTGMTAQESCAERKRMARFDVWFEGTIDYFNYTGAQGHFGLVKLGVDYKVAPGVLIGALVQYDRTQDKSQSMGYLVKGSGWMAGPYAAMRLGSNLFVDARYLRGSSENQVSPYLTYSDNFGSQRWLAAARLSGRWSWDQFSFTPSVEYVHFKDKSSGYVNAAGIAIDSQQVSINRLIFGPEFRYRTELNPNAAVSFSASVKGLWDANPINLKPLDGVGAGDRRSDFHARFDVGATLYMRSGVSADLSMGYEGLGGDGYRARSVTGRLKVPLN